MRIAIVTESFLPQLNGVTTSVCRVVEQLADGGHDCLVIAPEPAPTSYHGFPVRGITSVPVRQFPVGLPTREIEEALLAFGPDVVHVASPFVLGARGLCAAISLGLPRVAVYQTDMASYVAHHGRKAGNPLARATWRWIRWVHGLADLTLVPSSAALADVHAHGIGRTALWGRGVDTSLFHPGWRDDAGCRALRRNLAPAGETIVGYVGRLAPEKELHRLAFTAGMPGVRLVLVGEGPSRPDLDEILPRAVFLGRREGDDLARAYAACDVFVHTGTRETFGQTLQEAAATGLPVVAPARGGPLDLVRDGETGLLFDPDAADGPDTLAAAVHQLTVAEDAWERRALMGEAGLAAMADRSWRRLVEQLVDHYRAVIIGSRLTPSAP